MQTDRLRMQTGTSKKYEETRWRRGSEMAFRRVGGRTGT